MIKVGTFEVIFLWKWFMLLVFKRAMVNLLISLHFDVKPRLMKNSLDYMRKFNGNV